MHNYFNRYYVLVFCILQTSIWEISAISRHSSIRRGFIPNIEITDAYLRDHSPLMPLLEEESQKRTTLKEKELNFYGHLNVDRSFSPKTTAKHSELKEKNADSKDELKKAPYGR